MGKNGKKKKVKEQKVPVYLSTIESDIIHILGNNQTTPAVFSADLEVGGIYTYHGRVYCLEGGMDFSIEEVSEKGQNEILTAIKEKKYKLDNTFQ